MALHFFRKKYTSKSRYSYNCIVMSMDSFESLETLLIFVFRQLETPQLTLDKISDYLSKSQFRVSLQGNGIVASNTIPRRLIVNCLSNSDEFVRSGPAHAQTWALRPNNPFFQCDAAMAASVEQMLNENGPMTIEQFIAIAGLPDADVALFERVLSVQRTEFMEIGEGRYWFANSPLPVRSDYESVAQAIDFALTNFFREGATIEELRRFLCLSTHDGVPITRMCVSHELACRQDLFQQIQRGRYALVGMPVAIALPPVVRRARSMSAAVPFARRPALLSSDREDEDDEEHEFNPDAFFGGSFSFSPE